MNPSATELTTAATDAAMGVLCLVLLARLMRTVPQSWVRGVWQWVFALLIVASMLGAVAHGLVLPEALRRAIWLPLYLALGLTVALFVVGGLAAWRGEAAARRALPLALGAGVVFFALSELLGGAFVIFVIYEAAGMLLALAIYLRLAAAGTAGAWTVAWGIALTLVASGIQASSARLVVGVPFDHNGLFHLVQMLATVVVARGVRVGLAVPEPEISPHTARAR